MVQTQTTSYPLDCAISNTTKKNERELYLHKFGFQTKPNSQVEVEKSAIKNYRYRSQGLKLQPLDVSTECERKTVECTEKKLFVRLSSSNQSVCGVRKQAPSKIPVFQKSSISKNQNNDSNFDSTLSAADKRQKFHQSRQYINPAIKKGHTHVQEQQQKIAVCNEFIPWCNENYLTNVNLPTHGMSSKFILPPIKNLNTVLQGGCTSQVKKKCLMGEITHFPALCNITSKPVNNHVRSTVPHLPSILPPPAAPPPSISTSLEKDANKVK